MSGDEAAPGSGAAPGGDARRIAENFFSEPDASQAIKLISTAIHRAKALITAETVPHTVNMADFDELDTIKVALLSYPIHVETIDRETGKPRLFPPGILNKDSIVLYEQRGKHFDICAADPQRKGKWQKGAVDRWCERVLEDCTYALKDGAKFVLIHELGYPSFCPGPGGAGRKMRKELARQKKEFDTKLQALSDQHRAIIIAGSYHDWETFENIAHIFFPGAGSPSAHPKLTSAHKVQEHIKVARGAKYPIYELGEANKLRFCVLVCTDAFDLNIFFRQVMYTTTADPEMLPVKIYFVPSFYVPKPHRHSLRTACQQLSEATGSTVVFTNQAADKQGRAVFVSGQEIEVDVTEACHFAEITPAKIIDCQAQNVKMRAWLTSIISKNWTEVPPQGSADGPPAHPSVPQ